MKNGHMTYHVTLKQYINFILENVMDDKSFMCDKFLFSSIICAKVLDNK